MAVEAGVKVVMELLVVAVEAGVEVVVEVLVVAIEAGVEAVVEAKVAWIMEEVATLPKVTLTTYLLPRKMWHH